MVNSNLKEFKAIIKETEEKSTVNKIDEKLGEL